MFRVAAKNTTLIPAAEKKIAAARQKLAAAKTARNAIPAKLPANVIDPEARTALLRTVVPLKCGVSVRPRRRDGRVGGAAS
ncbi:MAG: hypothetical protein ACRET2_17925 [Steroidobacteraceae bacterium]